jgi:DNA-directed RNA polymerase subunit M/transcription elongation factor TFIIS
MVKFCEQCNSLLTEKFIDNKLVFRCELCYISYPSSPSDSLRKERIKGNDIILSHTLNKAVDDPATIKAYVDCIRNECDGKLVKQVRMTNNLQLYNICIKCRVQWIAK